MGGPIIFSLFLLVPSTNLFASNYFDEGINYWSKSKGSTNQAVVKEDQPKKEKKESQNFNWDQYINPKTKNDLKEVFRMKTIGIDIIGNISMVKVHLPMLGYNYYDYLSLTKLNNDWKIVNKVFAHVE